MIIDTHVHVIAADQARYPLAPLTGFTGGPGAPWYSDTPVSAEEMIATNAAAGVDRAILVQPFGAYAFDNAYHADSAATHPDRFTAVCTVDALAADAPAQLRYWVTERGMTGLRLTTSRPGIVFDDPATYPLWDAIRDLAIPVCVLMSPPQLPAVRAMAARYPTVAICLDHAAGIVSGLDQSAEVIDTLLDLASLPNVHLKVSSVNFTPLEAAGAAGEALWRRIVGRYGPERLLWGTNYPVSQDGSYADMVQLGQRALPFLTVSEREAMLGGNALRLWPMLKGA